LGFELRFEDKASVEARGLGSVAVSKRLKSRDSRQKPEAIKNTILPKGAVTRRTPTNPQIAATNARTIEKAARLSMEEY